jgi:serine/threonine protein kinase
MYLPSSCSSFLSFSSLQIFRAKVSTIWECIRRQDGTRHCVKVIDRRRLDSKREEDAALREIAMLTSLRSYYPTTNRLSQVLQVTEDAHHFYIVMEFVEGGSLASVLLQYQEQSLDERGVQQIARELLKAVDQLHDLNIGHFGLQPENILLKTNHQHQEVVLCDFASSMYMDGKRRTHVGNLHYAAPEVLLKKNAGLASDMWSVGVILYYCLVAYLPFDDLSKRRLKDKICKAQCDFTGTEWNFVTRGAKQFLSSLLHPDPNVRVTVKEALEHPWLSSAPLLVPKRIRRSLAQRMWGKLKLWPPATAPKQHNHNDLCTTSTFSSIGSVEESMKRRHLDRRQLTM